MLGNGRPTKLPSTKEYDMIDLEKFKEFYYSHSNAEVCKEFSIKESAIAKILKENNLEKKTKEQVCSIIRNTLKSKSDEEKADIQRRKDNTCLDRYGVKNSSMSIEVRNKISKSLNEMPEEKKRLRTQHFKETMSNKTNEEKEKISQHRSVATLQYFEQMTAEKRKEFSQIMSETYKNLSEEQKANRVKKGIETKIQRYGKNYNSLMYEKSRDKLVETNLDKYGVPYYCMAEKCRSAKGGNASNTTPNNKFARLLEENNIVYTREFRVENYSFDFKVNDILIEIDPAVTHNVSWSPFGNKTIDKNYHYNKSKCAFDNGYRCIHIFDWDNVDKIVSLLKTRDRVFARNCKIKEISRNDTVNFLNEYHLQGYAKDSIRLGLFYEEKLVSVMTFGKPRYNKNFDYELIRYCSIYDVIGGAEKLFSYFIKNYSCSTIISYCDFSKFTGQLYEKLGFIKTDCAISKHWYRSKTNTHITDNLLRQRGFDQLFNTNYGKNTCNESLMLENDFVEIYDAGQIKYEYYS